MKQDETVIFDQQKAHEPIESEEKTTADERLIDDEEELEWWQK